MRRMIQFARRHYAKLSIRLKILISIMAIIILAPLSISIYYYMRTTAYVQEDRTKNFLELMKQTQISLDNIISRVEDTGKSVVLNETLESILLRSESESYTLSEQLDDYAYLSRYITMSSFNDSIGRIQLYFVNKSIYAREKNRFYHVSDAEKEKWYERALFVGGASVWSHDGGEISCVRAIMRYDLAQSDCGFVEAVLNLNVLTGVLNNVIGTTEGNICLIDDFNQVVLTQGADGAAFSRLILDRHLDDSMNTRDKSTTGTDEAGQLIISRKLSNDWTIYASLPHQGLRAEIRRISYEIVFIYLGAIILAFVFVMLYTSSLVRRIRRTANFMSSVDINSDEYVHEELQDELTIIETSFNQMLRTARESVRKEKEALKRSKEADFDILQEQINPHFLYNCLDSINWLAIKYQATEISAMVTILGRFFRLGLSRGNQIIPLYDELEHVRLYLEIMKKRFDGQIDTVFDVDVDAKALLTLKFILQPLVENAIAHGISNRPDQTGCIRISCHEAQGDLFISVTDNGIGMTGDKVEELTRSLEKDSKSRGFGLYNVNQRIRLHFGEAYGVDISSVYLESTTVTLRLPVRVGNDTL